MRGGLDTAGERVVLDCALSWVADLIAETVGDQLRGVDEAPASVAVVVETARHRFPTRGWELLTRGAWRCGEELVLENACTSGFDVHVRPSAVGVELTYRWRPPVRDRAAGLVLRSRFRLLVRAALLQYPVLWWAGTRGKVPLHANAVEANGARPLVTCASGVGRSTLVLREVVAGATSTGDNLSVGDGRTVWGLLEPARFKGTSGRRMPHGRREAALPGRLESLAPDSLVVLRRGGDARARLEQLEPVVAARDLVASTYMAGELRRYWPFAATLAAGTGIGPVAAPVGALAGAFAEALPCFTLHLGSPSPGVSLSELLAAEEVALCA